MHLEIDATERALLLSLLDEMLGDLRDEIYRAESHDFKERLRIKKDVVTGLMIRLRQETPACAAAE